MLWNHQIVVMVTQPYKYTKICMSVYSNVVYFMVCELDLGWAWGI